MSMSIESAIETHLVSIVEQDVMESIEMERVTVRECAVHIKENGLDGAQVWERSVSRVSAHRDSSNLDRLCRGITIRDCHHIEAPGRNYYRLQVDQESMHHNAFMTYIERLSVQGIMESLPAAYFGICRSSPYS